MEDQLIQRANPVRSLVIPYLLGGMALAIAFVGALLTVDDNGPACERGNRGALAALARVTGRGRQCELGPRQAVRGGRGSVRIDACGAQIDTCFHENGTAIDISRIQRLGNSYRPTC